ncbi:hypothetical protein [Actinoplanes sp. HUAS TT8]|uniref:hypothetical protein n=1 Tax=Actinoplanes sp. HUAS TT8 TaxID=3447453 RepID=UPI003F522EC5
MTRIPYPLAVAALLPVLLAACTTSSPEVAASPVTTAGAISTPADGAEVQQCARFTGTATLADGKTLVLAMKNIDNNDPTAYVQFVENFGDPSTLSSWRGVQFFGNGDDSAGQHYQVSLLAVDLVTAQDAAGSGQDADVNALAAKSTELATVKLTRIAGTPADHCA